VALALTLSPARPPVIHGQNGVSQKSAGVGRASHYYSFTRLKGKGTLRLGGDLLQVRATGWMDHEFGSNQLTADQVGWDWFSIQLDDGADLMLYRIRLVNGQADRFSSGTLLHADGKSRHLTLQDFRMEATGYWTSPPSGGRYPVRWKIEVPSHDLSLSLEPVLEGQELIIKESTGVTYWEGSVRVFGQREGKAITGKGYLELTGYAEKFRKPI